jgi:hypothetical protein
VSFGGLVGGASTGVREYGLSSRVIEVEAFVFSQTCSPMAAISISCPQSEHVIAGKKLAGLMPPAASVAASGMFAGLCERWRPSSAV